MKKKATDSNIVPFEPKPSPADTVDDGRDEHADVDLNDLHVGANVVYASLSNIELVKTTPEVFWSMFGTVYLMPSVIKYLEAADKMIRAIKNHLNKD